MILYINPLKPLILKVFFLVLRILYIARVLSTGVSSVYA